MKFSEFKYEHLDYEVLKKEYEERLNTLRNSGDVETFMKAFEELNVFRGHIDSMRTICSIRHTINTADAYYDKENEYWDQTSPLLQAYEVELAKIMLESPFRNQTDIPKANYLSLENTLKSFSEEIIEDMQDENRSDEHTSELQSRI